MDAPRDLLPDDARSGSPGREAEKNWNPASTPLDLVKDYVRRQPQTRKHTCHWPGCDRQCPPAMWGCKPHWFALPGYLQRKIWNAYEPGQEVRMDPSAEYIAVAREVQDWIAAHE